jgi:hypothetical protein
LTIHFNFDRFYLKYTIKEGHPMKGLKKVFLLLLTLSLVTGSLYSTGWAENNDKWVKDDPVGQEWSAIDLLVARPIGVIAGIFGTAIFIVSLPFTIPTGGVSDAANMFVVKPFQFSFTREFPDENI